MSRRKKLNLKYQMLKAIDSRFSEGRDKHSDKQNHERGSSKIYSYADRKGLIDTASGFANWIKENHSEIKNVNQIKQEHVQSFLNEKSKDCTNDTLKTYMSRFKKLDRVFDDYYKSYDKQLDRGLVLPSGVNETKLRNVAMTREDYNKLRDFSKTMRSEAAQNAIEVAGRVGLRVCECAKLKGSDYDEKNHTLYVAHSKGGKERVIEVTKEEDREYFKQLKEAYGDARVCPVQSKSLNDRINDWMKKCDLEEYIEHDTNVHAMRKMVAQEMYDEYKEQGLSGMDAFDPVSVYLGHGEGRYDLFKSYILNP